MQQQQPQDQNTIQTLVVHREQLTADNMRQLSEAGYTIMNDLNLLIFGRALPKDQPPVEGSNNSRDHLEVLDALPVERA